MCHPYEQRVAPGDSATLAVVFTSYSGQKRQVSCRPILPSQWQVDVPAQGTILTPNAEGCIAFELTIPSHAQPGRWVVPVDVTYHGQRLSQFREAILTVESVADLFGEEEPPGVH